MSSIFDTKEIERALSEARLSTYILACPEGGGRESRALELYAWNAKVSAALLAPLHICEVVIRNAASDVLTEVYGEDWPWSKGFERSLPSPNTGYKPIVDLTNARQRNHTTGKVIPELKFVFWQKLFTSRFDQRLWNQHLEAVFINAPNENTVSESRALIYKELENIRLLRNGIAHHEPIFSRDLLREFERISSLIRMRSNSCAEWMIVNQDAVATINEKPAFI